MLERPTLKPEKRAALEVELAGPPMPPAADYLWRTFGRLSARRSSNGFGFNPLGWSEIADFVRLSGLALAPWEIAIVEHLDGLFMEAQAKDARDRAKKGGKG